MSDVTRALGEPISCVIGGATYKLSPWTKRLQGQYEDWIEEKAFEAASRRRKQMGEEGYAEHLARLNEAIVAGRYAITGRVAQRLLTTVDGLVRLVWLLLTPLQPEVVEDDVREMFRSHLPEVNAAMERVLGKAKGVAAPAPNHATPSGTPAGPSSATPTT